MNDINKVWQDFRLKVIDPKAPDIQLVEMKRAFFAGALAYSKLLTEGKSETQMLQEMIGFNEAVRMGEA